MISDILKAGVKLLLFLLLLGFVNQFLAFVLDMIPPLSLSGLPSCFIRDIGLVPALRLFVSILVYGFIFKFSLSYFKTYI